MPLSLPEVSWSRVGGALVAAWVFFIGMVIATHYLVPIESPLFSFWSALTGGGMMVLFLFILLLPVRKSVAPTPAEP